MTGHCHGHSNCGVWQYVQLAWASGELDTVLLWCSDPEHPKLAGRLFVGGSIRKGGPVKVCGGMHHPPAVTPKSPLCRCASGRLLFLLQPWGLHSGTLAIESWMAFFLLA